MSRIKGTIDFIKRFYLEIVATMFFVAASIILWFYIDFWDFIIAEAIIVIVMVIIILLLRKIVGRIRDRDSKSVDRADYSELTAETIHSKLVRRGDIGTILPGFAGPYGGSSPRPMISMHEIEYGGQTDGKTLFGQVNIPRNEIKLEKLKKILIKEQKQSPSSEARKQVEQLRIYETRIFDIGGLNIKIFNDDWGLSYSFIFDKNSHHGIFLGATLERNQDGKIVIEGILKKSQPFSLSIHKIDDEKEKYSTIINSSLEWESIHQQADVQKMLNEIFPSMEHLMFDEKYFTAIFKNLNDLQFIIELIGRIYRELLKHEFGKVDVDDIKCYKCGTILAPTDKECSKCGSQRPTCKVCLLDLYPSEKQEVVQTPCCGIYAHKLHMIMWLERTQKCPNCKKRQLKWLDQLKESF